MSTSNLAPGVPLEFVVSHCSGGRRSDTTTHDSQFNSGSANLRIEEDPHYPYLGDIYARFNRPPGCFLSTQAERVFRETPGPYLEHIRKISRGWHHLRYLEDFMIVSTVPMRCKELTPEQRDERLNRVDISVIEYGTEMTSKDFKSPDALDGFLNEVKTEAYSPEARLIIVQDLSTLMIESLGAAFNIAPGFFRSHVGDYVWLNTRDPQAEIPDLEAFSQKSDYFSTQYVQPRYFTTPESLDQAKKEAESFNVLRRIDHDGRFKSWTDMPGSEVGLVRSKISLWVRPQKPNTKGWLGILLVDPSITQGFQLWSGYGNFHPPPDVGTAEGKISFPPYEGCVVQEFIFWTLNQARSKANVIPPSPDLLPLAFFTMICAQWVMMCEYVNTRLGQIEWEIELGLSHLYSQDFDHTVKVLLMWRRRMPIYHSFVERLISRLSVRYKSKEDPGPFNSWEDILINLRDILHRLEILHCRADKIMAVSMAVTAREESKKATKESHAVTRVSYLAFIFVPLSFLTGFFSMSGDFPVRTYWIYALTALPISICALGGLIFAGRIGRWFKKIREERRLWKVEEKFKGKGTV